MMKMKKFTGCVLIGLVMATSFTGCSLTNYKGFNNVFKYDKDANNELLYVDGDNNLVNLKNDGIYQLKPNSQVEILSDYGILLNYYADKNQDISCDIIRIKDNKILKTVSEYDGYIIEDSTLTIYCEGTIHHFDL